MSRIILSRHADGEPRLIAGWDRPLRSAFVTLYDDEGEVMADRGPMVGERLTSLDAVDAVVAFDGEGLGLGIDPTAVAMTRLLHLLQAHEALEYPSSNVQVDLTGDADFAPVR